MKGNAMLARPIPSRRARPLSAVAAGVFAALLAWSPVLAAVSWGDLHRVSTNYAYGWSQALSRTVTSAGTAHLHHVFTRDVIGGEPVEEDGPFLGVYYRRGNNTGSSWTPSVRITGPNHGDHGTVAADGKYVYVAWRFQVVGYHPGLSRQLMFRRNTNHGDRDKWTPTYRPFVGANDIDRPSISASGARLFIAYTDTVSGEIRLQRSTDNGATFELLEAIGATSLLDGSRYTGEPVVAASGDTVAVIWNDGTTSSIRISTDGGDSFEPAEEFHPSSYTGASAAGRDGRIAFTWVDGEARHVYARIYDNGTLGPTQTIVSLSDATTYKRASNPAVALAGDSRIGVAYSACNTTACDVGNAKGSSIRWLESGDNGTAWTTPTTIGSLVTTSSRRVNVYPSALYSSSTRRLVSWTAAGQSSTSNYRIVIRLGLGAP
jgi:hypothetical protein